jgi:hypothetical protein
VFLLGHKSQAGKTNDSSRTGELAVYIELLVMTVPFLQG